jgi:hypothetical protein
VTEFPVSRSMLVKARCSKQKGDFAIRFVRSALELWEAEGTIKISRDRATRGYGTGELNGICIGPNYEGCPYCENKAFFLCDNCRALNCQGSARKAGNQIYILSANCGLEGYLEGLIEKSNSPLTRDTGVAILNPNSSTATVQLNLVSLDGTFTASNTITLPANNHSQLPGSADVEQQCVHCARDFAINRQPTGRKSLLNPAGRGPDQSSHGVAVLAADC